MLVKNEKDKRKNLTTEELYKKVNLLLSKDLTIFRGFVLSDISIENKIEESKIYPNAYFTGNSTSGRYNSKYQISIKIPNEIIVDFRKRSVEVKENAKYDITIDSIEVSKRGNIIVTALDISEKGVSERELLKRRLLDFCNKRGFLNRQKKELPRLVTSIYAISSMHSNIEEDLLSNLSIKKENIHIVNCSDSQEIAKNIERASIEKRCDIIVLYRGGHEDEAMNIFSHEKVIEAIDKSSLPVCVALGHESDRPFVYLVADKEYSTPSAFAKEITMHNKKVYMDYLDNVSKLKITIEGISVKAKNKLEKIEQKIKNSIEKIKLKNEKVEQVKRFKKLYIAAGIMIVILIAIIFALI